MSHPYDPDSPQWEEWNDAGRGERRIVPKLRCAACGRDVPVLVEGLCLGCELEQAWRALL